MAEKLVKDSQGLAKDLVNDCISRRAAIDATWFEPSYTDPLNVLTEVRDRLKALPPAQPENTRKRTESHACDSISRQAAIAALGERPMVWTWSDYELGARNQYDADVLAIETVPAAQSFSCDHENDTISRQATIELIERMKPYHQDADDIAEMIANMPSAQLEPHWIPCGKQLPENGHEYLYCTDMGTVHMGVYWSGLGFGYGFKYVVAWMPLPEPYKEDDHETD